MQKRYLPLALFFAILLVFLTHLGARLTALPALTFAEGKQVFLTFDDGPSTKVTGRILDTLQKEQVKATFFIVSDRAEARQDTLRRIAAEGHTLGVHSATHEYEKIYASDEALLQDALTCAHAIERITGVVPALYRFPGGGRKADRARQTQLLKAHGLTPVGWNAVCGDEEIPNASPAALVERALATAKNRARVVLLLHDSAPHAATAEALPELIRRFRAAGYAFCAL